MSQPYWCPPQQTPSKTLFRNRSMTFCSRVLTGQTCVCNLAILIILLINWFYMSMHMCSISPLVKHKSIHRETVSIVTSCTCVTLISFFISTNNILIWWRREMHWFTTETVKWSLILLYLLFICIFTFVWHQHFSYIPQTVSKLFNRDVTVSVAHN